MSARRRSPRGCIPDKPSTSGNQRAVPACTVLPAQSSFNRLSTEPKQATTAFYARIDGAHRIVEDSLQWIVQRRKGNARDKNSGWASVRFHRERAALLLYVQTHFPDATAVTAAIQALPERHV